MFIEFKVSKYSHSTGVASSASISLDPDHEHLRSRIQAKLDEVVSIFRTNVPDRVESVQEAAAP